MANKTNVQAAPTTISISKLRSDFPDRIIAPGDPDYDKARTVFYGGVDRRPAVIIKVADTNDVVRVVNLARESGLPLAVRSGGHSSVGHSVCDDGIVLDLSNMKDLPIRGDHFRRQQAVDGEAVFPNKITDTPAEREASDPDRACITETHCESMRGRHSRKFAGGQSRLRPGCA